MKTNSHNLFINHTLIFLTRKENLATHGLQNSELKIKMTENIKVFNVLMIE